MKKSLSLIIVITNIIILLFSACSKPNDQIDIPTDTIVSVNGELILASEIDAVYQQYEGTDVTYEKIIDDSILEILVIQQAEKYNIFLTNNDIEEIMTGYRTEHPEYYSESIKLYGEEALKKKLKDGCLFDMVKNHMIANVFVYDSEAIQKFRSQDGFKGHLDNVSDDVIIATLQNELEDFVFQQWMEELKAEADIIYY